MTTFEEEELKAAWKEGKSIVARVRGTTGWRRINNPSWDFVHCEYRIEKEEAKYRPYKNMDEAKYDIFRYGGWLRKRYGECDGFYRINIVAPDHIEVCGFGDISYEEAFECFMFSNDAIFGKYIGN